MPTEEEGHNRGHKFPFMSSEIFNAEIAVFLDKFFEAPAPKPQAAIPQEESDFVSSPLFLTFLSRVL